MLNGLQYVILPDLINAVPEQVMNQNILKQREQFQNYLSYWISRANMIDMGFYTFIKNTSQLIICPEV